MEAQVYSTDGKAVRTVQLNDEVFAREVSEGCIYHAIRNELANARVGTAKTRTRGEVRGTSRKPWRQKGTGRARAGRRRSPVWVGGGTVFGPRPRDYSYSVPRKLKRLAMKSILSLKAKEDRMKVVEDFDVETGKTRDLVAILKNLTDQQSTVLICSDDAVLLKRAAGNVPWIKLQSYNRLRAHDVFYGRNLLILETAAKKLGEFYGRQ